MYPMKSWLSCHYAWNYVTKKKHIFEEFLFISRCNASLDVFSVEGQARGRLRGRVCVSAGIAREGGVWSSGGSHLLAQFDSQPCYVGQERRNCQWQIPDDVSESELGSLQQLSVEGMRTHGGCANSHPIIQRSCLALLQVGLCECRKALFEELSFRGLRYY